MYDKQFFLGIVGSLLRWALGGASVYAVTRGIFTEDQVARLMEGAALLVVSGAWIWLRKSRARDVLNAALELPAGSSIENAIKRAREL